GLVPDLVDMLDAPDPRLPKKVTIGRRTAWAANELVRINHNRNCLLCHAAARKVVRPETDSSDEASEFVGVVPIPTVPLPELASSPEPQTNLIVRVGTTYLRQDFSAIQSVDDGSVWPARQRFDFVVRRRELKKAEANDLEARLKKQ